VPPLDFALCHRMIGLAARMIQAGHLMAPVMTILCLKYRVVCEMGSYQPPSSLI
jgi:hypothetical protein